MATLVDVVNAKNETVDRCELPEAVFSAPVKPHLLHEVVRMQLAKRRQGTADTKGRSDVSGGGKKPWKQKGTGRARAGSTRSPLWRHGGTVHGPQPRSYAWSFPKRMRRNAIKSALAQKHREGKLVCLEALRLDSPKTGELEKLVAESLKITGRALFLEDDTNPNLELAARNNPRLTVVRVLGASVVDLLGHDTIIASEPALTKLAEVLGR